MPAQPGELQALLKSNGTVTLDASGDGTVTFSPDNANQRLEITGVVVSTDQGNTTPYPVATLYVGSTTSPGNNQGATASGNQDVFGSGVIDVDNAQEFSVVWTGGVAGSNAFAQITGRKYTRRQ